MEPTYELIKSIIVSEIWEGNQVNLKFKASNQEQPIETIGFAIVNQEDMMKKMVAEMAKITASNMAVSSASNLLGNLTGVPGVGSTINSAAGQMGLGYQMDPSKLMQVELTQDVKEQTIVNAFKSLVNFYEYDNTKWVFKL